MNFEVRKIRLLISSKIFRNQNRTAIKISIITKEFVNNYRLSK